MFSNAICSQLGHYVYFLRDPRDRGIFYVGKGLGNRVFAHVTDALNKQGNPSDKIEQIQAIYDAGKSVEHFILRHGLDEHSAFELEAAMIDFIGLQNLTNQQGGHHSNDFGLMSVEAIQAMYETERFDEATAEPLLLININKEFRRNMNSEQIYEATRASWKLGNNRHKAQYAVATYCGLTREVYTIHRWYPVGNRWAFEGKAADANTQQKYRHKSIAHLFGQGAANPVRYINC